jgi:hypothetical protein
MEKEAARRDHGAGIRTINARWQNINYGIRARFDRFAGMNDTVVKPNGFVRGLRWSARILSLAVIGVVLLFAFGEGFNPFHLSLRDWVLFLFIPLGLCLGMVVA